MCALGIPLLIPGVLSYPFLPLTYTTNSEAPTPVLMAFVAVCDQKILVFVLQMEKSKQSMWMG
jgi:hypothetical protein